MFYDRFYELCSQRGISVTKATEEIGLARSIGTKWKNTGATPNGATLERIADYFEITVSDLLNDEKKEPATLGGHGNETLDRIQAILMRLDPETLDTAERLLAALEGKNNG